MLGFWQAQSNFLQSSPSFENSGFDARYYPSEEPVTMLSAFLITGQDQYRAESVRQLDYARSLENADHLLLFPGMVASAPAAGLVSSLSQIRLALGYYVAFKALGSSQYLDWADQAVSALLQLPRGQACWNLQCFQLFYFLYDIAPPYQPFSSVFVNPNHDAFMGITMTVLYNEPACASTMTLIFVT